MSTVENEYIRNLQQQIYFLELECDYLRDQANRVVEIPNDITVEAAKLVKKLKVKRNLKVWITANSFSETRVSGAFFVFLFILFKILLKYKERRECYQEIMEN